MQDRDFDSRVAIFEIFHKRISDDFANVQKY